jgi:flagellar protein FliO/FliZ
LDLTPYLARLALLLPLMTGLIVLGLWAAKRFLGLAATPVGVGRAARAVRVTQTLLIGPGTRIAVVEFGERRLLLALAKGAVTTLAEAALDAPDGR